jgi:hypothetical protein
MRSAAIRHAPAGALRLAAMAGLALLLAGCSSMPDMAGPQPGPVAGSLPPAFPNDTLVGSWGVASYHQEQDRGRTEREARNQCRNPYVVAKGPRDGVMMHVADDPKIYELTLKGGPGGKTYLGFDAPPGHEQDREVLSYAEPVLVMRWVDPEVARRYGTMIYVRCKPRTS